MELNNGGVNMLVKLKDKRTIGAVMDFMCSNELNYEIVKRDENKITIKSGSIIHQKSCGSPTTFEFKGDDDTKYCFRIRNGYWRLFNDKSETITNGKTDNFDGFCEWNDAKYILKQNNVEIDDFNSGNKDFY